MRGKGEGTCSTVGASKVVIRQPAQHMDSCAQGLWYGLLGRVFAPSGRAHEDQVEIR